MGEMYDLTVGIIMILLFLLLFLTGCTPEWARCENITINHTIYINVSSPPLFIQNHSVEYIQNNSIEYIQNHTSIYNQERFKVIERECKEIMLELENCKGE